MNKLFDLRHLLFAAKPAKYNPVLEDESSEKDSFFSDATDRGSNVRHSTSRNICLYFFLALQSIALFVLVIYVAGHQNPSDISCAKQLSPYSPYLESGDLEFQEFTGKNHLMQPSIYRGLPTPEIEEAWIELWRMPTIKFPEHELAALNKFPPSSYAHVAPKYGEGALGFLDVFHQLHCLSTVRQYTYRDQYDYSNVTVFRAPKEVLRGHVDHCIETIRKAIMCASDVTPMVFIKDPTRPEGRKSDFNIRRKCRNFEKVQQWALENRAYAVGQIPDEVE